MSSVIKPKSKATTTPKSTQVRFDFEAIGTVWNIVCEADQLAAPGLARLIADRISQFDKNYSRFRSDSWVSSIRTPGHYQVPDDFAKLFEFYQQLYQETNGAVTPLIGDAMERAGYNATYSFQAQQLKSIPKLTEALSFEIDTLHVKYECVLDFGAAGKGYLVDLVANLLRQRGITRFVIDAGGDMCLASPTLHQPTPIGLEDPRDPTALAGVAELTNQSLCASASNRRRWGDYHHIINPHTLRPTTEVRATWVVADTTLQADGLATALFFTAPDQLQAVFDFEYMIMMADNTIQVSPAFPGRVI